jgi:hypothetical protein
VRPREIHLGLPFVGMDDAVSVFDAQFLDWDPLPQVDFDRIALPPRKRFFFRRLVSTLRLRVSAAAARTGLRAPQQIRARHSTHPVDARLSLAICAAQREIFRQLAGLHARKGFHVYVREGIENPPLRFVEPSSRRTAMNTIASRRPLTLHGLWLRLKAIAAWLGFGWGHNLRLGDTYRLGSSKVRVPLDSGPIEISLGMNDKRLHLYPEMRLNERGKAVRNGNFVIVDPERASRPDRRFPPSDAEIVGVAGFGGCACSRRFSTIRRRSMGAPGRHPQPRRPRLPQPERCRRGDRSGSGPPTSPLRAAAASGACDRFSAGRSASCRRPLRWN